MQKDNSFNHFETLFSKYKARDKGILSTVDKFASDSFSKTISENFVKPRKKIIPTTSQGGIREDLKKTFLPLLIDTIELRHMITMHKAQKSSPDSPLYGHIYKAPEEILHQLKVMQEDIEEAQRWCSGVISQIAKGIEEAKETLESPSHSTKEKTNSTTPTGRKEKTLSKLVDYLRKVCRKK